MHIKVWFLAIFNINTLSLDLILHFYADDIFLKIICQLFERNQDLDVNKCTWC